MNSIILLSIECPKGAGVEEFLCYHGRWNKYVEIRNMTINAGDADVGIKSSGSQLKSC